MVTPNRIRHRVSRRITYVLCALIITCGSGLYTYRTFATPLPLAAISLNDLKQTQTTPLVLPWPTSGQSALGSLSEGVVAKSNENQTQVPIASIAKVITSLAVLERKPLSPTEDGPSITLTNTDVALYNQYVAAGGSTAKVEVGEVITEKQLLEGLLLPSANNLADSLAIWAFGSLDNYIAYANTLLANWGITNTSVHDASGFSDTTTSTAADLVKIGQKALGHPVLEQIVQKKTSYIPVAGEIRNTNLLLNNEGIGIKTGHTNAAGGCLLFATKYVLNDKNTVTIIGSVLGQMNMTEAFKAADELVTVGKKGFTERTVIVKGDRVGSYQTKWGAVANIVAADSLIYAGWYETALQPSVIITPTRTVTTGQNSGIFSIKVQDKLQSVPVVAESTIVPPSIFWRMRHGVSI